MFTISCMHSSIIIQNPVIHFTIDCYVNLFRYGRISHEILFLYKSFWLAWAQAYWSINSEVTQPSLGLISLSTVDRRCLEKLIIPNQHNQPSIECHKKLLIKCRRSLGWHINNFNRLRPTSIENAVLFIYVN